MAPTLRLLIFIVTYNAEKHIEALLQRIPEEYWSSTRFSTEILVIDDASSDDTVGLCRKYSAQTGRRMIVLKNPVNQGYGGNQKIGYTYAIQNQFDVVVLLHGDGQYPPEMIGQLIAPIVEGDAAACFGSRMMHKKDALSGGMPWYRFIANILLTKFQNAVVGINLSEFHSGFRAYRVQALAALPFQFNSNDFDTDIIIQLAHTQCAIVEISIPTHYGNEICHVNGIKYAAQIIASSLLSKLQRFQICYHSKFDFEGEKTFYPSKNEF